MAVTSVSKPTTTSSNDKVFNPNSQLDKDAFMKLFLTELEHQDPTSPMDTDKMLQQTAYLSTMEMNDNMQKSLDNLFTVAIFTRTDLERHYKFTKSLKVFYGKKILR